MHLLLEDCKMRFLSSFVLINLLKYVIVVKYEDCIPMYVMRIGACS